MISRSYMEVVESRHWPCLCVRRCGVWPEAQGWPRSLLSAPPSCLLCYTPSPHNTSPHCPPCQTCCRNMKGQRSFIFKFILHSLLFFLSFFFIPSFFLSIFVSFKVSITVKIQIMARFWTDTGPVRGLVWYSVFDLKNINFSQVCSVTRPDQLLQVSWFVWMES